MYLSVELMIKCRRNSRFAFLYRNCESKRTLIIYNSTFLKNPTIQYVEYKI